MKRRFSSQFLGMNSVVIHEADHTLLVDPGVFPPELIRIREFIEKEKIAHLTLLLTHTHGDHISGWHAFRKYPLYIHEKILEKSQIVMDNDVRYLQGIYRKQGYQDLEDLQFPRPAYTLQEGKFVHRGPFSFAFFHIPGHSTDMCAIVIPEEQLLCSGDMLIQTPAPFILHSIAQYWQSLKRLEELVLQFDLNCLIAGHGKPAKSQEEILDRISHERNYVQSLVRTGLEFMQQNMSRDKLKTTLYSRFHQLTHLHSHQTNVQTFLREQNDLRMEDFEE